MGRLLILEFDEGELNIFDEMMGIVKNYPDFKRYELHMESSLQFPGLEIYPDRRKIYRDRREINLTAKEFDLLELLACNPNKVYSRESLLGYVWGNKAMDSGDVRTVDVHVRRLREKIEPSPSAPQFVHTKWGVGYYFRAQG